MWSIPKALDPLVELAVAALVFWAAYAVLGGGDRLRPKLRDIARRTHLSTDLCHWFANRIVFAPVWAVAAALLFAPVLPDGVRGSSLARWFADLPWALQFVSALLIYDVAAYWRHRLMHCAPLWRIHAVHHSSTHLNWLSGVRNHPLNTLVIHLFGAALLAVFGFPADIVAAVAIIRFYWVCFIHCDLRLDLGPLRYVITTPDFHRWHHVTDEVRNKNFAGFFSLLDLIFGTFHMPRGRRAAGFGAGDEVPPEGYLAQLAAPFQRSG